MAQSKQDTNADKNTDPKAVRLIDGLYRQWFKVENKLAPYELKYECDDDCKFGGCPGHKARFEYHSVSDIFSITWNVGEEHEHTVMFNLTQFSLIEDFMNRLKAV